MVKLERYLKDNILESIFWPSWPRNQGSKWFTLQCHVAAMCSNYMPSGKINLICTMYENIRQDRWCRCLKTATITARSICSRLKVTCNFVRHHTPHHPQTNSLSLKFIQNQINKVQVHCHHFRGWTSDMESSTHQKHPKTMVRRCPNPSASPVTIGSPVPNAWPELWPPGLGIRWPYVGMDSTCSHK